MTQRQRLIRTASGLAIAVALVVATTAGCTTSSSKGDDRQQVADTVTGFVRDLANKRFDAACERLTGNTKRDLAAYGVVLFKTGASCPKSLEAFTGLSDGDWRGRKSYRTKLSQVRVNGKTAVVDPSSSANQPAHLVKTPDGRWLIDMKLT